MKRFETKVAVVTGGNSGIGYAAAEALAAEGARVVITGRKKDAVLKAAKAIGALGLTADQADIKNTNLKGVFFTLQSFQKRSSRE